MAHVAHSLAYARDLDARDELRAFREEFSIPTRGAIADAMGVGVAAEDRGKPCVYLCGNSLGLMPKATRRAVEEDLEAWERLGVEGHFHAKHPWFPAHEFVRASAARLVGAREHEVVAMNSLTVNLHLLMASFYRPSKARYKIVIEDSAFPSDSYAVQSQAAWHGLAPAEAVVRLKPRAGEMVLRTEDVEDVIREQGASIALVMLGGVNYLTGQLMDMARITEAGRRAGAMVGWDLAHAAGNAALSLHEWGADFACWCTYKYLNSGPGAVAGAFVHERHTGNVKRFGEAGALARLAGWWGNDPKTRFVMGPEFVPTASADAWAMSNPPILALSPVRVSLGIFDRATMPALRRKSERLTGYLRELIDAIPGSAEKIEVITPKAAEARGCQLSLAIKQRPREFHAALQRDGVVCDFREPNIVRVAPTPLYNTFEDCFAVAEVLRRHCAG